MNNVAFAFVRRIFDVLMNDAKDNALELGGTFGRALANLENISIAADIVINSAVSHLQYNVIVDTHSNDDASEVHSLHFLCRNLKNLSNIRLIISYEFSDPENIDNEPYESHDWTTVEDEQSFTKTIQTIYAYAKMKQLLVKTPYEVMEPAEQRIQGAKITRILRKIDHLVKFINHIEIDHEVWSQVDEKGVICKYEDLEDVVLRTMKSGSLVGLNSTNVVTDEDHQKQLYELFHQPQFQSLMYDGSKPVTYFQTDLLIGIMRNWIASPSQPALKIFWGDNFSSLLELQIDGDREFDFYRVQLPAGGYPRWLVMNMVYYRKHVVGDIRFVRIFRCDHPSANGHYALLVAGWKQKGRGSADGVDANECVKLTDRQFCLQADDCIVYFL